MWSSYSRSDALTHRKLHSTAAYLRKCLPTEAAPPGLTPVPTAFCSFSFFSYVRPLPTLFPSLLLTPHACGRDLSLTHWTLFWLVSEVGPPYWCPGMPCFTSYVPAGSANSATPTHSHTLALSSRSCSSQTSHALASHSLATNTVFPVLSFPASPRPVLSARPPALGLS